MRALLLCGAETEEDLQAKIDSGKKGAVQAEDTLAGRVQIPVSS